MRDNKAISMDLPWNLLQSQERAMDRYKPKRAIYFWELLTKKYSSTWKMPLCHLWAWQTTSEANSSLLCIKTEGP